MHKVRDEEITDNYFPEFDGAGVRFGQQPLRVMQDRLDQGAEPRVGPRDHRQARRSCFTRSELAPSAFAAQEVRGSARLVLSHH